MRKVLANTAAMLLTGGAAAHAQGTGWAAVQGSDGGVGAAGGSRGLGTGAGGFGSTSGQNAGGSAAGYGGVAEAGRKDALVRGPTGRVGTGANSEMGGNSSNASARGGAKAGSNTGAGRAGGAGGGSGTAAREKHALAKGLTGKTGIGGNNERGVNTGTMNGAYAGSYASGTGGFSGGEGPFRQRRETTVSETAL